MTSPPSNAQPAWVQPRASAHNSPKPPVDVSRGQHLRAQAGLLSKPWHGSSRGMVVRSGARCSPTSSARLLQGRGLPPRPADGVGGWRSRGTDQGCGGSDCVPRGGHVGPDGTVRGLTPSARRVTFAEASPGRQARGRRSGDRDSAIVVMPRRVFGRSGESAETRGPTPPALPRPPTTWGISICRQPPPPAAIVDHAQPQMTHGEQRPPGMAREKESSWSGPGHRSTAAPP